MKKGLTLAFILFLIAQHLNAQIEVDKLVGKNAGNYAIGYGAFLQFAFPVSDAAVVTAEGGIVIFFEKEDASEGIAAVPVKIGYRYTFNGEGNGFTYIHRLAIMLMAWSLRILPVITRTQNSMVWY